ncbi:MAG: hypothetical protein GY796_12430 [Chloroflexi bacterium]|nr:hypothetical protein [Chloroflexota bacterium]
MTTTKDSATQNSVLSESSSPIDQPAPRPEDRLDILNGAGSDGRWQSFLAKFQRQKTTWVQIEGYRVDELRLDEPVLIEPDATLLGNVIAPKILVKGLLSGSVCAREVQVTESGQIWGDVFSASLQIEPGGIVQGWVGSLDEDGYQQLRTSGTLLDETAVTPPPEPTHEEFDKNLIIRDDSQIASLHRLQAELATTLAARHEMEQEFERRLTEKAGEARSKISILTTQITTVRTELTGQKKQLDETQETLRQQKSQIERQTNELTVSRDLMSDQNQELSELRDLYTTLRQQHQELDTEKTAVDTSLEERNKQVDSLHARNESLEIAHRASLQYTSEQDDSLMRWQELAEVTEKKAAELETQMQQAELQLEESANTIQILRKQRQATDAELEKALAELRNIQESKTERLVSSQALTEAVERIAQLKSKAADKEQEYLEQIIWYKASLGTSRSELEQAREQAQEQADEIHRLETAVQQAQTSHQEQAEQIQQLQQDVELVREDARETQVATAQKEQVWLQETDQFKHALVRLEADKKNKQATLRESQMQLKASEDELSRYLAETRTQGQHLAEIQAQLVERELQLQKVTAQFQQAKAMVAKQNQFIKQMKELTGSKIKALNSEIACLKRQQ